MSGYLYSDAKARAKVLNPALADIDSTKFNGWSDNAIKLALESLQAGYVGSSDLFVKKTKPNASSGSEVVATTADDIFQIALATDALQVANDTIYIYNAATADFLPVPRIEMDAIVVGTTTLGFWETQGNINLYVKESSEFTTVPFTVQYDYWRMLAIPAADGDPLDIKQGDFDSLMGLYMGYMPQS